MQPLKPQATCRTVEQGPRRPGRAAGEITQTEKIDSDRNGGAGREPTVQAKPLQDAMTLLAGKRALVAGVANERSLAWGIAQAMHREGAELAFACQNEKLQGRVERLAAEVGSEIVHLCDVAEDEAIRALAEALGKHWDSLDVLVHSLAFAPREALQGGLLDGLDRSGFRSALEVSAYSLAALTAAVRPLLERNGGAVLTLSYLGAERAVPNYNVMGVAKAALEAEVRYLAADLGATGIRVNAISAGPIRTLAAAGIAGFRAMLQRCAAAAPLKRNVTPQEVGNAATFLCSDHASAITGQVLYVDAGFSILGLASPGDPVAP